MRALHRLAVRQLVALQVPTGVARVVALVVVAGEHVWVVAVLVLNVLGQLALAGVVLDTSIIGTVVHHIFADIVLLCLVPRVVLLGLPRRWLGQAEHAFVAALLDSLHAGLHVKREWIEALQSVGGWVVPSAGWGIHPRDSPGGGRGMVGGLKGGGGGSNLPEDWEVVTSGKGGRGCGSPGGGKGVCVAGGGNSADCSVRKSQSTSCKLGYEGNHALD